MQEVVSEFFCEADFMGCPKKLKTWADRFKEVKDGDVKKAKKALDKAIDYKKGEDQKLQNYTRDAESAADDHKWYRVDHWVGASWTKDKYLAAIQKLKGEEPANAAAIASAQEAYNTAKGSLSQVKEQKESICGIEAGDTAAYDMPEDVAGQQAAYDDAAYYEQPGGYSQPDLLPSHSSAEDAYAGMQYGRPDGELVDPAGLNEEKMGYPHGGRFEEHTVLPSSTFNQGDVPLNAGDFDNEKDYLEQLQKQQTSNYNGLLDNF
eukprot:TRINITY_DN18070_c0_g2_i1.p1 TRINITY_DN18070_c0_g2~~TRINITY_DN18070_c0_g2_i1.p1  ORF type:complete len:263 (-),score=81.36 TRINITY_DN18070_c0_g2_i1:280-1068(-)